MSQVNYMKISASEAAKILESEESVLVDVRTASEYKSLHAAPAQNFPLHNLSEDSISSLRNRIIICICQSGARGQKAAELFCHHGFQKVYNLEGGTNAWLEASLPVVKGESSISIERQVRIVAGFLVFLGTLLGILISNYFLFVPLFVGLGFVFAGITNTCGMALFLAKCPWNR